MLNEYYPENTSPDCFENYGGHHIDDRMRARGNSYASHRPIDTKVHFTTPEILEEKKLELQSLQQAYKELHAAVYGENGRERMAGDELAQALMPLESMSVKMENIKRFIATARVINEEERASDKVEMLSKVTVRIQGIAMPITLCIVGENEADASKQEVSCVSPVGKALLGRKAGESVNVQVGSRVICYNILSL